MFTTRMIANLMANDLICNSRPTGNYYGKNYLVVPNFIPSTSPRIVKNSDYNFSPT
ncbi:hypothetical protein Mapa_005295 [Marchantia paleacea]|nr:hypothetical protein Mapa_005295 [Marchantia paleacea]